MAEQTSLVAQQVRLMHWAEQIRECQNRPEGMGVSTNPLKRVRQMYLDQLPEAEKPAFVELPRLKAERTATVPEVPVMCIKNGNGLSAEREEGADKILDYYRASKGAFLCIQKNKRILHYGYIIKQSL